MTEPLLAIAALSAARGGATVLDKIDATVDPGEIVAVLGANGSGKSTLLQAVMGFAPARAGVVRFAGVDITRAGVDLRARLGIGYVPEGRRVFPGMTVRENLEVACRGAAAMRARRRAEIEALFPRLAERRHQRAWSLSGGEQQMLAIGRALMAAPRLLLLDEPSAGLAPRVVAELLATLVRIRADGTAILLAEQSVSQALAVADRAYALSLGRIVASGTAAALAADEALAARLAGFGPAG